MTDMINHPPHYTNHPSGVEQIQITEHMGFCLGNAVKYIWRAGEKSEDKLEDLRKAQWYLNREIRRLEQQQPAPRSHPTARQVNAQQERGEKLRESNVTFAVGGLLGYQSSPNLRESDTK